MRLQKLKSFEENKKNLDLRIKENISYVDFTLNENLVQIETSILPLTEDLRNLKITENDITTKEKSIQSILLRVYGDSLEDVLINTNFVSDLT